MLVFPEAEAGLIQILQGKKRINLIPLDPNISLYQTLLVSLFFISVPAKEKATKTSYLERMNKAQHFEW